VKIIDGDLIRPPKAHRVRRVAIEKRWPVSADGNVYIPYRFSISYTNGKYTQLFVILIGH